MIKTSFRLPLVQQILLGMVMGVAAGLVFGKACAPAGEVAKAIISIIKVFATPLLFVAIVDSVTKTQLHGKSAVTMLSIAGVNAAIAIAVGLAVSNVLQPGVHLASLVTSTTPAKTPEGISFMKTLIGYLPQSIIHPFMENNIIAIIVIALLTGCALRYVAHRTEVESAQKLIYDGLTLAYGVVEQILGWLVKLVPIAVAFGVARTVGEHGLTPIVGLSYYLGAGLAGLAFQVFVVYQLWLAVVAKVPLGTFWRGMREALVYALGASSSLATLPLTLKCLKSLGVSDKSSRLACCVGTNFNNDGILLYEAMATLFVAQAYGIHLTIEQQVLTAISCAVAGMGIAGVPEAGLISLSLVLATVGLPVELLPILLSVDWILSRARAMTNVTSDAVVSILLDRFAARRA